MADALSVRRVETKADFRIFFGFPWRVHAGSPEWTPPLLSMRSELLDKQKNPAWSYMEGEYFLAWRGNEPVGAIAAFVNHRHNETHDERVAWFGAFDVLDDQEAANALFDRAADFARSRGQDALRGPQTFTTHEECGLLVEGFGRPVLLMPWNPPRYQRHVEGAGLVKYADLYSFIMSREMSADTGLSERLQRITRQVMKRNKISIRPINRKDMKGDFRRFRELYNDAWDRNQGFVPMTEAELDALVASLGQFLDPDFAFFASVDGDLAGFVLGIPDLNQVLHRGSAAPRRAGTADVAARRLALEAAPDHRHRAHPAVGRARALSQQGRRRRALLSHSGGLPGPSAHSAGRRRLDSGEQRGHDERGAQHAPRALSHAPPLPAPAGLRPTDRFRRPGGAAGPPWRRRRPTRR